VRAHFLVYGDVRTRREGGKNVYALRLEGMVVHAQVLDHVRNTLATEMASTLPRKVNIPEEDELKGFEFTSSLFGEASKFILATASLLSGDLALARNLLEKLEVSRSEFHPARSLLVKKSAKTLHGLIPLRLADVYLTEGHFHYQEWCRTREIESLKRSYALAKAAQKRRPDTIQYFLVRAIHAFVVSKNVKLAYKTLQEASNVGYKNAYVRYAMAFLDAYEGKLTTAEGHYGNAFKLDHAGEAAIEVEEFLEWVIAREPERYQLHYCLGLINEHPKCDTALAARDYADFLRFSSDKHPDQQRKARAFTRDHPVPLSAANDAYTSTAAIVTKIKRPAA
jgi:tetratricopeptide (TPR) repeat protein